MAGALTSEARGGAGRMFLGEHQHNLDVKGRITLPARFRELLGTDAVLSKGKDGCLSLHRREEYLVIAAEQRELMKRGETERTMARSLFAGAVNVMVKVACVPVTTLVGEIVNVPLPLTAAAGLITRLRPPDVEVV